MIHTDLVYILTTLCNLFENIYGLCFCNVNILCVCKNIHENFFYSKVFPGIKYAGKAKKKEGMPAFQNIKDLTNHNSKITKYGSSHYEGFCETNILEN